jgi:5-methyltetrahydrofolate--homocysteine methyltransferase
MTFNSTPRGFYTIMGNSVSQCLEILEVQGVPVLGTNCTLNSAEMVKLIKIMREKTSLPLIAQPNAGNPSLSEDGDVVYSQSLNDYILYIPEIIENGANLIGGCCGTNVEHIKRMAEIIYKD